MSRPTKKEVAHKQKLALNQAIRDFDRTWEREVQPVLNQLEQDLIDALTATDEPIGAVEPYTP